MLCTVIKGPNLNQALEQLAYAKKCADIVEIRADLLERKALKQVPFPWILTLRSKAQGGNFSGSKQEQIALIHELCKLNPTFVDWEYDLPIEQAPNFPLIISYHNFEKTPDDLPALLKSLQRPNAAYYKIATFANSTLDALRMLKLVKESKNLIGLCMEKKGQMTRILAPFSYCSLEENPPLGQLNQDELINTYRFKQIDRETKVFGLIGSPVDLSIGHIVHNAVFAHFGINAVYVKIEVIKEEVKEFLELAKMVGFCGLSVTMPLKEVLPEQTGAINTLTLKNGRWMGCNTDGTGAVDAIEKKLSVKGKHVVLIGVGGAAKAIACELKKRGASITVLNRTKQKACDFADQLKIQSGSLDDVPKVAESGYDILINASANLDPIDCQLLLPHALVMDIHTIPVYTPLLKQAEKIGCPIVFGYEMFAGQAIEQLKAWFKQEMPDLGRVVLSATKDALNSFCV